jgi:hypothetical protein
MMMMMMTASVRTTRIAAMGMVVEYLARVPLVRMKMVTIAMMTMTMTVVVVRGPC